MKREACLDSEKRQQLREELEEIATRYNLTEYLDMPDFLVASVLIDCIEEYNSILKVREKYKYVKS